MNQNERQLKDNPPTNTSDRTSPNKNKLKLSYGNTVLVGLAFMTISCFWQLYDFIIPLILKNSFRLDDGIAGFIMSLDNIIALFLLPFFGMLSDKTRTPMGRRKPYIIGGTVASVLLMMIIPFAAHTQQLALFMVGLGLVLLTMAVYRSPAVALMPDITPKPLRSKGNAVINLMGAIGGAIILLLLNILAPDSTQPDTANYFPVFIGTAAIMVLGVVILVTTINEPKLVKKMRLDSAAIGIDEEEAKEDLSSPAPAQKLPRAVKRSMAFILASIALWFMGYNAVTSAFSKYAILELNMTNGQATFILMVALIAATISFIPIGIISSRIGRKKSILIGVAMLASVFATTVFYKAFSPLMYVTFTIAGIGWAAINVNSLPMVLEMSKGSSVGKYTGYYYTFSMAAQVVTPILSGLLLQHVGYFTLFPYAALFIVLAFFTMLQVRHGDSRPDMPADRLEAFDAGD